MQTDEYLRLIARIQLNVAGFAGQMITGDSSDQLIGLWAETAKEQGDM